MSAKKTKLYAGLTLVTAVAAIMLLDHEPIQHERAASHEMVIDMPAKPSKLCQVSPTPLWCAGIPLESAN